ncbi:MAG: hypothetical protein QXW58_06640 [Thermosphaera sp.]
MSKLQIPLSRMPTIHIWIKGRNGKWFEFKALISTCSEYGILSKVDAFILGYDEALVDPQTALITGDARVIPFITFTGIDYAPLIRVDEIRIGNVRARDVEFLAYDLPRESGFDVIVGQNILARCGMILNYSKGVIEIEATT